MKLRLRNGIDLGNGGDVAIDKKAGCSSRICLVSPLRTGAKSKRPQQKIATERGMRLGELDLEEQRDR